LFVQWQGKGGEGWYSAKIYDYIGSRRPILALTPRSGIVADIIARTSSGIVADDESNIRKALLCLYDEYMKNGYVSYSGNETEIAKNTRKSRTQRLAALLDEITDRRTSDIPVERQA
jgi:hypothetical protein